MRKITTVLFGAAALMLSAFSCTGDISAEVPVPDTELEGIVLYLAPGKPGIVTRADDDPTTVNTDTTRPGDFDGSFRENRIDGGVDVFFFTPDSGENTPSVYHDHFDVGTVGGNPVVTISASTEKMNSIFGDESNGNKAYVVVIANYGSSIDHSQSYSLSDLCDLDLPMADWNVFPQSSFAMISDNGTESATSPFVEIEITGAGSKIPVQASVSLKRLAAKVTFRITISDQITVVNTERDAYGTVVDHSLVEWEAIKSGMSAYLQYAIKTAKLSGTPVDAPGNPLLYNIPNTSDYDYMAYGERPLMKTTDTLHRWRTPVSLTNNETHDPVYGTPEKQALSVYEVCAASGSTDSGPFYTYPVTWTPGAGGEPFIKLIIPWRTTGANSRTKYYYYKIPFKEAPLKSNHWYVVTLDVQILGGEDQKPVPLQADYQIVNWEKGTEVEVPAEVQSARYLSVPITEWVMYNVDDLTIPITSSHDIQVVGYQIKPSATTSSPYAVGRAFSSGDKALATTWVGTDPRIYNPFYMDDSYRYPIDDDTEIGTMYWTKANYNATGMGGAPVPITTNNDASGWITTLDKDKIVIHHELINDTAHKTDGVADYDVTPYYLYFRVQHRDKPEYYKDILVEQRPAIIIEPQLNSDGTDDEHLGYVYINNQNSNTTNTYWYRVAGLTGSNTNPNMYVITTSVLTSSTNIIGDPRDDDEHASGDVYSGWSSASAKPVDSSTNRRLTNYYPTSEEEAVRDYIAPSFRVASSYGVSRAMSYADAKRRCASYQEDGYPAGRWRLPTSAEVLFITTLSADKMIPELFTFSATSSRDKSYWCAGGAIDGVYGVPWFYDDDMSTNRYVRCVYDEWFWENTTYDRVADKSFTWGDQLRENVVKRTN